MTNEMINRRVEKIQDEMTYKQSERLEQLIDALNVDFETFYL